MTARRILLVCTGNTCRSPMAAALLRGHLTAGLGLGAGDFEVASAGLAVASEGEGATAHAAAVMAERGLSLADHRARSLDACAVGRADLILTMTAAQKGRVLQLHPAAADRVFTLAEYAGLRGGKGGGDIPDPIGGDMAIYRRCAEGLDRATAKLALLIASEEGTDLPHVVTPPAPGSMVESVLAELPVAVDPLAAPAPAKRSIRRLAVGADHAGYALKDELVATLSETGIEIQDFGTDGPESVDYPDFAARVAAAVVAKQCDAGLLVCGTGLGMAIAANKVRGVRAVTCNDLYSARMCREHNDANVLCIGARVVGSDLALEIVRTFLRTPFGHGRHVGRVRKIADLEAGSHPDRQGKDR